MRRALLPVYSLRPRDLHLDGFRPGDEHWRGDIGRGISVIPGVREFLTAGCQLPGDKRRLEYAVRVKKQMVRNDQEFDFVHRKAYPSVV